MDSQLLNIPLELLQLIIYFLDPRSKMILSETSKSMKNLPALQDLGKSLKCSKYLGYSGNVIESHKLSKYIERTGHMHTLVGLPFVKQFEVSWEEIPSWNYRVVTLKRSFCHGDLCIHVVGMIKCFGVRAYRRSISVFAGNYHLYRRKYFPQQETQQLFTGKMQIVNHLGPIFEVEYEGECDLSLTKLDFLNYRVVTNNYPCEELKNFFRKNYLSKHLYHRSMEEDEGVWYAT